MLKIKNLANLKDDSIVLKENEIAVSADNNCSIKIGDGTTPLDQLEYIYIVDSVNEVCASIEDLKFIKETAEKLCGIADNISSMFGHDHEMVKELDKIESAISKKVKEMLDN